VYETLEMTPEEIAKQNAAYTVMGLFCVIADVRLVPPGTPPRMVRTSGQ
jgi:hypothetical protein